MRPTLNEKFIAYLALLSGLSISAVAVYYSVAGLTSIFSAAVIPIIIMGTVLEIGKLVATVWLKQNWNIAPFTVKTYLMVAILVLMLITSMGIFGFLSKAHSDQSLVSGDSMAKVSVYDEKIKVAKDNIDAGRKALKQMDDSVDQVMGRSTDEKGADKAVSLRRSQQKERQRILTEIENEQKKISGLNEERAPLAAEFRKVEAEVGPIKYIAAFVYGSTDQTILEKAVTWVIITLIIVFDPLAVILLLASQISFQNFRDRINQKYEADDGPLTDNQISQLKDNLVVEQDSFADELTWLDEIDNKKQEVVIPETKSTLDNPHEPGLMYQDIATTPHLEEKDIEEIIDEFDKDKTPVDEPLFIQNEEQKESDLWTSTTIKSISREEYLEHSKNLQSEMSPRDLSMMIARYTELLNAGGTIDQIPEEFRPLILNIMQNDK